MPAKDSSQFDVYSGVTSEEMNQDIGAFYGIVEEDPNRDGGMQECPQCNATLRGSESFCGQCGAPLTDDAAATITEAQERTGDTRSEAAADGDAETTMTAEKISQAINENPEAFADLLEGVDM